MRTPAIALQCLVVIRSLSSEVDEPHYQLESLREVVPKAHQKRPLRVQGRSPPLIVDEVEFSLLRPSSGPLLLVRRFNESCENYLTGDGRAHSIELSNARTVPHDALKRIIN